MPIYTHTSAQTGTNTARERDRQKASERDRQTWNMAEIFLTPAEFLLTAVRRQWQRLQNFAFEFQAFSIFPVSVCLTLSVCVYVQVCVLACVSALGPQALRARLCGIREIFDSYFNEIMQAHFHTLKGELQPCPAPLTNPSDPSCAAC